MQFSIVTLLALAGISTAYVTHEGFATYYTQDGNPGSCGDYHSDSDLIVAITDAPPFSNNAHCGQTVTIKNTGGGDDNYGVGNVVTATVADTCRTESSKPCSTGHLDLSVGTFQALTGGSLDPPGEFNIEWHLN